ncbi:hypothetical protein C8Q76DRAFT_379964 [Earliella scabrosa]|nr:hypothetical protein C8Q76DRAFT_379964 [Earliella scabrosa]
MSAAGAHGVRGALTRQELGGEMGIPGRSRVEEEGGRRLAYKCERGRGGGGSDRRHFYSSCAKQKQNNLRSRTALSTSSLFSSHPPHPPQRHGRLHDCTARPRPRRRAYGRGLRQPGDRLRLRRAHRLRHCVGAYYRRHLHIYRRCDFGHTRLHHRSRSTAPHTSFDLRPSTFAHSLGGLLAPPVPVHDSTRHTLGAAPSFCRRCLHDRTHLRSFFTHQLLSNLSSVGWLAEDGERREGGRWDGDGDGNGEGVWEWAESSAAS